MISLQERCNNYKLTFPDYPEPVVGSDNRIQGTWILGNNYRNKTEYYGAYPPSYLKRVYSLFPDIIPNTDKKLLHLFSGSIDETNVQCKEIRFDRKKLIELEKITVKPDVVGNAEKLSNYFTEKFDLILADPPYSEEDAKRYGTSLISRNKVVKEAHKILKPNGFLVWLDQVLPMYRKTEFAIRGAIGIVRSTNHRFRMMIMFQKLENTEKMQILFNKKKS